MSSGYANNLGALRNQRGLIEYPSGGFVALTREGQGAAVAGDPIEDVSELHHRWYELLPNPQANIVRVLVAHYPDDIERAALAEDSDSPAPAAATRTTSGGCGRWASTAYPSGGRVVATDLLFPEGL